MIHLFEPVFDDSSRILILGSFPSVKSRETMFYYGNPQNRFWKVLSSIFKVKIPLSKEEKIRLLLENHIALWDVAASCEVVGSSDSSISKVIPTDLSPIFETAEIEKVLCNGKTAFRYYQKVQNPLTGVPAYPLPSSSSANARYSLEELTEIWKSQIL